MTSVPQDGRRDGDAPDDPQRIDALTLELLTRYDTITVVGASADPRKEAHGVPALMQSLGWRIIPVNPTADEILGERVYRTLADVPEPLGLVDVFRPGPQTPPVVQAAVDAGAQAVWLQLGIASADSRRIAGDAGVDYVEDRCLAIEIRRHALTGPRRA
jgi:predicted CoA-binding protein